VYFGQGSQIEIGHVIGAQSYDLIVDVEGVANEAGQVHAQALITEGAQVGYASFEVVYCPTVVAQPELVEAHTNAEDALVEVADWAGFQDPKLFERLVLLEVFATVELFEARVEERRRGFVARPGQVGPQGVFAAELACGYHLSHLVEYFRLHGALLAIS
jgi:hypothetical protein